MWQTGLVDGGEVKLKYGYRRYPEFDETIGKHRMEIERWITGPYCQKGQVHKDSDVVIGKNRYKALAREETGDPEIWMHHVLLSCENCV